MTRQSRKLDHLRLAAEEPQGSNGFADVLLVHCALPGAALAEVDMRTRLCGRPLPAPLVINAMTGGVPEAAAINAALARVAARYGLAMAVGSQTVALHDPAQAESFAVVRRENPHGLVLANLGAGASPEAARDAVAMLQADVLQIHLNAAQELVMSEGDRDFRPWLAGIERLVQTLAVPVLVKEVGFGLSGAVVRQLYACGVRAVDVGGRGGTNFARIEARREAEGSGNYRLDPGLEAWGIPTAAALAEVAGLALPDLDVVASGGVVLGSEAAKALALGAAAVGVAGPLLKAYLAGGEAAVAQFVDRFLLDLRRSVLLSGAASLAALRQRALVILGDTGRWCDLRGVDLHRLAQRE